LAARTVHLRLACIQFLLASLQLNAVRLAHANRRFGLFHLRPPRFDLLFARSFLDKRKPFLRLFQRGRGAIETRTIRVILRFRDVVGFE
jgi:hypothetical protein